jgi:hypothetical protein
MLKLWEEKEVEEHVYLKLISNPEEIFLICCDKKGDVISGGDLFYINKETRAVKKFLGVATKLGFKLDGAGRVVIE